MANYQLLQQAPGFRPSSRARPDEWRAADGTAQPSLHADRLHLADRAMGGLSQPGRRLWRRWRGTRHQSGRFPSARLRQTLLGVSGGDLRTDSFVDLGSMYGTRPGFYLLVGPNWKGEVPKGITKVFRSKTNSGVVGPRVFVDDTPKDKRAVQELVSQIDMYPLAEFDGKMKRHDWTKVSKFPGAESKEEVRWVFPDKFVDQLPAVLRDAPPLPGEEARYAEMLSVIEAANKDPALKQAITDEVTKADKEVVAPLLQFRNWGIQLPNNWSTCNNGAASRAPRWRSRTSSSTNRMRRSISIKTSMCQVRTLTETIATPLRLPGARRRR